MSKWKCKTPYCKKPCYAELPEHHKPINCVLDGRKPDWRKEDEPTTNSSQLPKLTAEVFDRPDCPEWAKYAAVDKSGVAFFYENKPICTGTCYQSIIGAAKIIDSSIKWDIANYQNILIERQEKNILPDWCKVGEWGYNPSRGLYFEIVEISDNHIDVKYPHITNECYRLTIEYFKECNPSQARLRPYNAEEMRGLIGKVLTSNSRSTPFSFLVVYAEGDGSFIESYRFKYTAEELKDHFTIDGKPCGVLEHLENGEWGE